ncbi:MAG: poly(R)-hydroxyalkanoic acid synthase subunit PhaE [Bacteroidia bacterium]
MKTANPFIDSIVETQTNFVNNWMDSAKKMQSAFSNGNIAHEGQNIYKEWLDKQMSILTSMKDSSANLFSNANENNPQEFFKTWFNQQAAYAKQMTDFNQSIYNSYSNFGKPAQDYMSNFGQMNTSYTNIYNAWMNTLNTAYDTMSKNMNGSFNKDIFTNFMQGNQMYAKMQEFFGPMAEAMQKGKFNMDAFKNHFTPESYSNLSKQMFGNLYNGASIKEVYDNGMKQIHDFFTNQNGLTKEYFAQVQNMAKEIPNLFNGNTASLKDLYGQINNVFGKTFEPLLKLATPGKEKESIEATIALMDKMAEYSIKQAELQLFLQNTTQKSIEKVAQQYSDKFKNPAALAQTPNVQDMYNEWVKTNEELFAELFATEEFSKVKGEALNLSMDVKKHFEKQFEQMFESYPIVFKSEVEELQKTIYDLKKQVKDLQTKLSIGAVETADEDKAKNRKK